MESLENALYEDLGWRRKELSSLYLSALGAKPDSDAQSRAVRAGIVLAYAHLEGFSRQSIRSYFVYVKDKALKYSELAPNFLALKISQMVSQSTTNASYYGDAVALLTQRLQEDAELPEPEVISAKSNLTFGRLSEMLYCINLSPNSLATKQHFLDNILLDRRNAIAHGEFRKPTLEDYVDVHCEVLDMLDVLHELLVTSAIAKAYRI
jgi:hypothetical protein